MGVIPKVAVRRFLNREREDNRHWKKYKLRELNAMMRKLPVRPPIWKKLQKHQRVCLLLAAKYGSWAFFLDTGCGKTLLSIALARYLKAAKKGKRFLVLVPNNVNLYEWEDQIKEHSPKTKYTILEDTSAQKWEALRKNDSLLYIATYPGLMHMVSGRVKTKKGKVKMAPVDRLTNELIRTFDGCFFDESTKLGHYGSLTTRICWRLAKPASKKLIFPLTGTPFGRDPKTLWAQMRLVDGGHSLGETLGLFQSAFYSEDKDTITGFPEYTFKKKMAKTLNKFIAHRSISYAAEGLPRTLEIEKLTRMSQDAEAHYTSVRDEFLEAVKNKGVANPQIIKNTFLRMRQISSGFIGYYDDDSGIRAAHEFKDNPKLELLLSILESISPKYKAIIFVQYTFSGSIICRELEELELGYTRIYGATKDRKDVLAKFKEDPGCRFLVLNNDCGGFGLNLQVARYGIYFETPVCPIMRKQTRRRFERQYSEHKSVVLYDLMVRNTYDQTILQALKDGRNLFEEVMRGRTELLDS